MTEEVLTDPAEPVVAPTVRELVGPLLKQFQSEYNVGNGRIDLWNELCAGDSSMALSWDYRGFTRCIRIYQIADQLRLTGYAWADGHDDRLWRRQEFGIVKHVGAPGVPWQDYLYEFIKSTYATLNTWEMSTLNERAPYVDDFSFEQLVIGSKLRPGFPINAPPERSKLSSTFFLAAEWLLTFIAILASIPNDSAVRWALIVFFGVAQLYMLNRYARTRRQKSVQRPR